MAWSGGTFTRTNGTYSGANVWANDKAANVKIVATRHDTHDEDLADGINNCLTKDGQNSPTGNISWGTYKITNLGNGTAAQDAAAYGQTITAASWDSATGTLTLTRSAGNITAAVSALPLAGGVLSGDVQFSGASFSVRANTADAADTKKLVLAGGGSGATTRGAYIELHGNEHATDPGELNLFSGSGFDITMLASNVRMTTPALYVNGNAGTADLYLQAAGVSEGGIFANVNSTTLWHDATAINLRPGGRSVTTGQFTVAAGGNVTAGGTISDASGNVRRVPVNEQNAAYTFALTDLGKVVRKSGSTAIAYTIDPEGTTAYGDGFIVTVRNANAAGNITLTRGSGVVLRQSGSSTDANVTVAPWATVTLVREALNTWVVL